MNEMRHQALAVSLPRTAFWDGSRHVDVSCDESKESKKTLRRVVLLPAEFAKMLAFFRSILDWIKSLFWKEEMELTLVGLQYSGKTTFVNVIAVSVMNESFLWSMPTYFATICLLYLYLVSF